MKTMPLQTITDMSDISSQGNNQNAQCIRDYNAVCASRAHHSVVQILNVKPRAMRGDGSDRSFGSGLYHETEYLHMFDV